MASTILWFRCGYGSACQLASFVVTSLLFWLSRRDEYLDHWASRVWKVVKRCQVLRKKLLNSFRCACKTTSILFSWLLPTIVSATVTIFVISLTSVCLWTFCKRRQIVEVTMDEPIFDPQREPDEDLLENVYNSTTVDIRGRPSWFVYTVVSVETKGGNWLYIFGYGS